MQPASLKPLPRSLFCGASFNVLLIVIPLLPAAFYSYPDKALDNQFCVRMSLGMGINHRNKITS